MNSKSNNSSIKPQSTNTNNISHGAVTIFEQNPNNSNLDFNVVRDIAPSVPATLATPQNGWKNLKVIIVIYCKHLCNQIILTQLVAMLPTHYNLLLNVKITPRVSVICLLLLTVT